MKKKTTEKYESLTNKKNRNWCLQQINDKQKKWKEKSHWPEYSILNRIPFVLLIFWFGGRKRMAENARNLIKRE